MRKYNENSPNKNKRKPLIIIGSITLLLILAIVSISKLLFTDW